MVMAIEALPEDAVAWTKPDDVRIDLETPKGVFGEERTAFHALMGDGSVTFLTDALEFNTPLPHRTRRRSHRSFRLLNATAASRTLL